MVNSLTSKSIHRLLCRYCLVIILRIPNANTIWCIDRYIFTSKCSQCFRFVIKVWIIREIRCGQRKWDWIFYAPVIKAIISLPLFWKNTFRHLTPAVGVNYVSISIPLLYILAEKQLLNTVKLTSIKAFVLTVRSCSLCLRMSTTKSRISKCRRSNVLGN